MSALWIVAGVGALAAALALLVGVAVEWGAISGAFGDGWSFDRWLFIEIGLVAAVVLLLIAATKQARRT